MSVDPSLFFSLPQKDMPTSALASLLYTEKGAESAFTLYPKSDSSLPSLEISPPVFLEKDAGSARSQIDILSSTLTNIFYFCVTPHEKYSFHVHIQLFSLESSIFSSLSLCTVALALLLATARIEAIDTPVPLTIPVDALHLDTARLKPCSEYSSNTTYNLWMCKGAFSGRILSIYMPSSLPLSSFLFSIDYSIEEPLFLLRHALKLLNKL